MVVIDLTKFEQVGVNYQHDSCSKREANQNFKYSCRVCCERGIRIECDRCAIAATHSMVVAALESATQGN